jgi:hypothetical protein
MTTDHSDPHIGFGGDPIEPDWDGAGKVHDWRNYITDKVRTLWPTFSRSQKIAIAEMAQERAEAEEWD